MDINEGIDWLNSRPSAPGNIPMQPVTSSNLDSVGYDYLSGTLYVSFKSGSMYSYDNVEKDVYNNLLEASSKGSYFYWNIRMSYNYTKIG
jgi:hypothetical protein